MFRTAQEVEFAYESQRRSPSTTAEYRRAWATRARS